MISTDLKSISLCPICNKPRGGGGHSKCSKQLQVMHAADRHKPARKLAKRSINFLVKLGEC